MSNSTTIYNRLLESASAIQRRGGQVPQPDPTLRAFFAALIWQLGILGVDTGDKASALVGLPRAKVDYARLLLENDDPSLIDAALNKTMSLHKAALLVRRGVMLVDAYVDASPANKAHLGRTVGADTVWDEVVIPALDRPTAMTPAAAIVATATAPQPNGKAASNGAQPHARPVAPPAIVNVTTH